MKIVAAIVVGLLLAGAIAWFAGEQHYNNCIDAARLKHPISPAPNQSRDDDPLNLLDRADPEGQLRARRAAIDGCAHLP